MLLTSSIDEVVARGATFLDQQFPGWADVIDLPALDIGSGSRCALAQTWKHLGNSAIQIRAACPCPLCQQRLVSPYETALAVLGLSSREGKRLGFVASNCGDYPLLTEAWRLEVVKRRMAKVDATREAKTLVNA